MVVVCLCGMALLCCEHLVSISAAMMLAVVCFFCMPLTRFDACTSDVSNVRPLKLQRFDGLDGGSVCHPKAVDAVHELFVLV